MYDKETLINSFNIWWQEEGKFKVPSTTDYIAVKELLLEAWLNGAYKQCYN